MQVIVTEVTATDHAAVDAIREHARTCQDGSMERGEHPEMEAHDKLHTRMIGADRG
tara:strand:+ start:371 stop:538 length:168 start_codon:yes stop_codon:yes gene_type:complete